MSQHLRSSFGGSGEQQMVATAQPIPHRQQHESLSEMSDPDSPQSTQPARVPSPPQPGFIQNTQLPGVDMSVLEGISPVQLAQILTLFKSGHLTLPPAPPAPPTRAPVSITALSQSDAQQVEPQAQLNVPSTQQEDEDMDREEGEVEEGDVGESGKERGFLHPPPTGPRKVSSNPRDRSTGLQAKRYMSVQPQNISASRSPNMSRSAEHCRNVRAAANNLSSVETQFPDEHRVASRDVVTKNFIRSVYDAGYTFDDLAGEVRNRKLLCLTFAQLGLPLPADYAASSQPQQLPIHRKTEDVDLPSITGSSNLSSTKRAAPIPFKSGPPANRTEYLAKLAAAKNKKAEVTTTATSNPAAKPVNLPIVTVQKPGQPMPASPSIANLAKNRPSTEASLKKTELAKQKLEALKAQQAAKLNGTSLSSDRRPISVHHAKAVSATDPPPTETNPSVGSAGSFSNAAKVALSVIPSTAPTTRPSQPAPPLQAPIHHVQTPPELHTPFSSVPLTPGQSFSGLPGLFMAPPLAQPSPSSQPPQSTVFPMKLGTTDDQKPLYNFSKHLAHPSMSSPAASPGPLAVHRKRPAMSDPNDISNEAIPTPLKRPFGQSRLNSYPEPLIIEVSDDEGGEDDDENMSSDEHDALLSQGLYQQKFDPSRDFPNKQGIPVAAISSTPGTPLGGTPGAVEYQRKLQEIEEFKRKIAEKEARKGLNGKASANAINGNLNESASTSGKATPITFAPLVTKDVTAMDGPKQASPPTDTVMQSGNASTGHPVSAAALARQREKARLEQRLLELMRDGLPSSSDLVDAPTSSTGKTGSNNPEMSLAPAASIAPSVDMEVTTHGSGTPVPASNAPGEITASRIDEDGLQEDNLGMISNLSDGEVKGELYETAEGCSRQFETPRSRIEPLSTPLDFTTPPSRAATQANNQAPINIPNMRLDSATEAGKPDDQSSTAGDMNEESSEEDETGSSHDFDPPIAVHHLDEPQMMPTVPESDASIDDAFDRNDVSSPSSNNSECEDDYEPELNQDLVPVATPSDIEVPATNETKPSSYLASELQRPGEETGAITSEIHVPRTRYKSYRSALSAFKDFRYHSEFLDSVPGGFKSMTYSHNIDPVNPLCPFETAGGACNDRTCEYQHFETMNLTDNDLLRLLGTHRTPVRNADDEQRWREGLGAVVKQLRTTNQGKDAAAIAARIALFRRQFIGDPTKTLNLD